MILHSPLTGRGCESTLRGTLSGAGRRSPWAVSRSSSPACTLMQVPRRHPDAGHDLRSGGGARGTRNNPGALRLRLASRRRARPARLPSHRSVWPSRGRKPVDLFAPATQRNGAGDGFGRQPGFDFEESAPGSDHHDGAGPATRPRPGRGVRPSITAQGRRARRTPPQWQEGLLPPEPRRRVSARDLRRDRLKARNAAEERGSLAEGGDRVSKNAQARDYQSDPDDAQYHRGRRQDPLAAVRQIAETTLKIRTVRPSTFPRLRGSRDPSMCLRRRDAKPRSRRRFADVSAGGLAAPPRSGSRAVRRTVRPGLATPRSP